MAAAAEKKALWKPLSPATTAVRVERGGLELLRGRDRFHLDEREVQKLREMLEREG